MTLCLGLYTSSGNGTKAAAQATCSQTIAEFCKDLGPAGRAATATGDASGHGDGEQAKAAVETRYNDALPVFQFVSSHLDEITK